MERIKNLNGYQKALLIIMIVAVMVFSIIYPNTISKVGFKYNGKIFIPTESDDGSIIYSGKIDGTKARFVVSPDKTVGFYYGEKSYGPYTVTYDSSAIPESLINSSQIVGIEVLEGDKIIFRGGVHNYSSGDFYLYPESSKYETTVYNPHLGRLESIDDDDIKPSIRTILRLKGNPELTHNGSKTVWLMVTALCILNAVTILFEEELFRFEMFFEVRNPESVEPSDWYIMSKYIVWTLITILSVSLFIFGLQ